MSESSPSCIDLASNRAKIEAIPVAMRRMGWSVSASLMERWLRSRAWTLPREWKSSQTPDVGVLSSSHIDEQIVRMSWAMSYPRLRSAMKTLRSKMLNEPSRRLLGQRVAKTTIGRGQRISFGSLQTSAVLLDQTCQANFEIFGSLLDTMDDMYGALGKAALKVALIGEAGRHAQSDRLSLKVTHAGFYIRDTYDFNDVQYLGTWSRNAVLSKAQMVMNAALDGMIVNWDGDPIGNVTNGDFDKYRCQNGYGGDFLVYSDVYWEAMDLSLDLL